MAIGERICNSLCHFNLAFAWRALNSKDRSAEGAADFV
jgi:hypothetical protein